MKDVKRELNEGYHHARREPETHLKHGDKEDATCPGELATIAWKRALPQPERLEAKHHKHSHDSRLLLTKKQVNFQHKTNKMLK